MKQDNFHVLVPFQFGTRLMVRVFLAHTHTVTTAIRAPSVALCIGWKWNPPPFVCASVSVSHHPKGHVAYIPWSVCCLRTFMASSSIVHIEGLMCTCIHICRCNPPTLYLYMVCIYVPFGFTCISNDVHLSIHVLLIAYASMNMVCNQVETGLYIQHVRTYTDHS